MLEIQIDGKLLSVADGSTVMDAATQAGVYIPHFCYHKKLSIAANCRMCLVDVEKAPKPLPACATPVTEGMKVRTQSELARKAQAGVMEFLLINHPLDCPICDQGGECQLQDLAVGYGKSGSRYEEDKRTVSNKDLGALIATDMTRCIHCTRCVRFGQEVAGVMELGMVGRGEHSEIMPFLSTTVDSEISGNMIDLCPVGALTSKPFRYTARTWELSRRKSVSPHDGLGSNLVVQVKQNRVYRVLPLENDAINECWISDKDRFSYEALNSADRLTKPMIKQGGEWIEVDWAEALAFTAHALNDIKLKAGADSLAGLISANSTLEELFLFQKMLRELGCHNVDHRLRQSDFSGDAVSAHAPWFGMNIADFSNVTGVLLVGCNLRKEHPLLATRLRHAVKHGAKVSEISAIKFDHLLDIHASELVAADKFVATLAAVVNALSTAVGVAVSPGIATAISGVKTTESAINIAQSLRNGDSTAIVLGALVQSHPAYSVLLTLANEAARLSGATVCIPGAAANSVGAYVAGAVPMHADHRGANAADMLAGGKQAYLVFNSEPELDAYNGGQALATLMAAPFVAQFTQFKSEAMLAYADVLLPITPFTETAGTFVNMMGTVQSFNGVVKPLGDSRPGWKVLRVLSNQLELAGFDYVDVEEVRKAILIDLDVHAKLSNVMDVKVELGLDTGVSRVAEVPMYQGDVLVRRAGSLQKTVKASSMALRANTATLTALGVAGCELVSVKQGQYVAKVQVVVDENIAPQTVSLPVSNVMLGGMFDSIEVERA